MNYSITEDDFYNLYNSSMAFGEYWKTQEGRFEDNMDYTHKNIYWFSSYTSVLLAKIFLTNKQEKFIVSFDLIFNKWVITTNYRK